MKNIIFILALTALFSVQVSAKALRCDEKCLFNYCIVPNQNNNNAINKCVNDAKTYLSLVRDSCGKQDYSDSCIKQRVLNNSNFINFFHCMRDCYPNGIIQVEESPIVGKIHDLTQSKKKGQVNKQTNPTPTPAPQPQPPTTTPKPQNDPEPTPTPQPKVSTTGRILNCFIGLVTIFLGVLIF
ncbi:hypothetical protein ABPG72_002206 [Tetrahymena utriculariae]